MLITFLWKLTAIIFIRGEVHHEIMRIASVKYRFTSSD